MWNMYIDNILPVSQSYQEPPGVSWNYCACPITRLIYPGSLKVKLILWWTHFALVNQLDLFFLYLYCYFCIQLYLHCCANKWYTQTQLHGIFVPHSSGRNNEWMKTIVVFHDSMLIGNCVTAMVKRSSDTRWYSFFGKTYIAKNILCKLLCLML